jgi:hypothetical protein
MLRARKSAKEKVMAAMLITSAALLTCALMAMAILDLLPRGR